MNRLLSFRELLNKPSGIYNTNGINIRWYLEKGVWEPHDIIAILRTTPNNIAIHNLYNKLKDALNIIDNCFDRLNCLLKLENLNSKEFNELEELKNFFLKAKDSIYNTDEKIIEGLLLIA